MGIAQHFSHLLFPKALSEKQHKTVQVVRISMAQDIKVSLNWIVHCVDVQKAFFS